MFCVTLVCRTKEWRLNGKTHREGDLPAVIFEDGGFEWHFNGELHMPFKRQ